MAVTSIANLEPLAQKETMRYRPFGKTGLMVSALSMGCMRLGEDQDVNTATVARAIDLGVNYFETTRFYCDGKCQQRTAPGLKGKTGGIIISGKEGIDPNKTEYLFRKEIERQLEILGLSHFKFFQVGWFCWDNVKHLVKRGGVLSALRAAQDEGLIHHVGFTGHDTPENFIKCIETGIFDSITVPYNMINRMYEPTIARAGELGVGVVAMCPVAGGTLSYDSAPLKKALNMDLPTTDIALRFVLSNPSVSTACSGMSSIAMVEQNVKSVFDFDPTKDTEFGNLCEGLDKLRAGLGERFCTGCRYCMPCPQKVNIPWYMEIYRNLKVFGLTDWAKNAIANVNPAEKMELCSDCGICETKCPNTLKVRDVFKELKGVA